MHQFYASEAIKIHGTTVQTVKINSLFWISRIQMQIGGKCKNELHCGLYRARVKILVSVVNKWRCFFFLRSFALSDLIKD